MRHMLMEMWSSVDEDWNFHQQVRGPRIEPRSKNAKKIRSSNMSLPLSGVLQRFGKKITPTAAIPIPNLFSWSQG